MTITPVESMPDLGIHLLFNIVYFILQTGPLMAFRRLTGGPSNVVP